MKRWAWLLVVLAAACGGRRKQASIPVPAASPAPASVDSLWTRAQYAVRHGRWSEAIRHLDRLLLEFLPGDPRIPEARYFLGEAHLARDEHLDAARLFRKVVDEYPEAPIASDALLRVADAYAEMWRRPELDPSYGSTALSTYREVVTDYPSSTAARRAEQRITDLNERFAYKAYRASLYYVRLKAYDSAIIYLKDLVANYPRTAVAPDAVIELIRIYRRLDYRDAAGEMCDYFQREYGSSGPDHLCRSRTPATPAAQDTTRATRDTPAAP